MKLACGTRTRPTPFYRLLQAAVRLLISGWWGLRARGLEHVPERGRVIVAVNHISLLDPPAAAATVFPRRYPLFVGKEELFRNPVTGWFLRATGTIPLDRARGDVGALRAALSVLEAEGCIVVFPEGTRSRTGEPGRPKPGVSFLAHQSGAPVVPVRVRNTERVPPRAPIELRFGRPMRYDGDGGKASYRTFAEAVMSEIFKL